MKNISGGATNLYENNLENQIGSLYHTSNYRNSIRQKLNDKKNLQISVKRWYNSNDEYWKDVLDRTYLYEGIKIGLSKFHMLEWLPQYPGLIHTGNSFRMIQNAVNYVRINKTDGTVIEYEPDGKAIFLNAGFGSLRLGTKIVNGVEYYLLSATSSGVSHEGIPIVLTKPLYEEVIHEIRNSYGVLANIEGEIRIIPHSSNPILSWKNIPSYYLFAQKIEIQRASSEGETKVSISIAYNPGGENIRGQYKWSFKEFYPDGKDNELFESVAWLKDYAQRYSESNQPLLIGDFDEFIPHFDNNLVELPKVSNHIFNNVDSSNNKKFDNSNEIFNHIKNCGVFSIQQDTRKLIVELLSNNHIGRCVDSLFEVAHDEDVQNYLVLIKSQFNRLESDNNKGLITNDEFYVYQNRITHSLLQTFISSSS